MYELSSEKIGNLIDTFDYDIDLNLRIPNTVLKEFNKNIETQKYTSDNDLNESLSVIKETLKKMKKKLKDLNIWDEQAEDYTKILNSIISYEKDIRKKYYSNHSISIPKLMLIDELIIEIKSHAYELEEIDEKTKIAWMTEGFARTHYNYPPGYEDQAKFNKVKDEFHRRKKHPRPNELESHLGDFYIWKEILNDSEESSKVFITNDLKKDWWEIPSEDTSLTKYKPREELIKEYNSISPESTEINFIPFDLFINYFLSYYNEDFNQDLLYDLVISNYEPYIVENGADWTLNEVDKVISKIESDIINNYDYNMGLDVKDWDITLSDVDFDYMDYDTDFNLIDDNSEENIYNFCFILYYEVQGEYNLSLGLEDTVFDASSGNFKIDSLAIECDLIVEIPFNTDKNQIKSGNIFDEVNIIDINFEFHSNSSPEIIPQYELWDNYFEDRWRDYE